MGVNTSYLGHVEIEPPLNKVEYDYLTAFARSRRSYRRAGRELFVLRVTDDEPRRRWDAD
jgi:hypothetical protein